MALLLSLHFIGFIRCFGIRVCNLSPKNIPYLPLCQCRCFLLNPCQTKRLCLKSGDIFEIDDVFGLHHPFLPPFTLSSNPYILPWSAKLWWCHVVCNLKNLSLLITITPRAHTSISLCAKKSLSVDLMHALCTL
jgi:hypothetical protein